MTGKPNTSPYALAVGTPLVRSIEQVSTGSSRTSHGPEYLCCLARDEKSVQVRIVRRKRRTMALYVTPDMTTELRVPLKCPWELIHHFLAEKFDWIIAAENELAGRPPARRNSYEPGGKIRFMGDELSLSLHWSRWVVVRQEGAMLRVSCPDPGKLHLVEKHVMHWCRQAAERIFMARMSRLNADFDDGITPGSLRVRKMKARWGSCSLSGEISLNLLLIKEAPPQVDYVIAHELCHLRHFAHNDAFYQLLTRVMPDWQQREAVLGQRV